MDDPEWTNHSSEEGAGEERIELHYSCVTFVIALDEDGEGRRDNGASRGERYDRRRAQARAMRDEVLEWLEEQGVAPEEVAVVSEPTVFGTFTVETTPQVARLLEHAPHVAHVIPADDVSFDLLRA